MSVTPAWALAGASFLAQGQDAAAADDQLPAKQQRDDDADEHFDIEEHDPSTMGGRQRRLWLGQYKQFEIIEANRELGEQVRQQESILRQQRDDSIATYNLVRAAKCAEARGQQAMTDQAMREAWTTKTMRVSAVKSEHEINREKAMRQKQAWAANGSRMREQELVQKRKVFESRSKAEETRRSAATRAKQETTQRRATRAVAVVEDFEARRRIIEKLRKESLPSGALAEAREYVGKQKREAAAEVRSRELAWGTDRRRAEGAALERATQARAGALSSRRHAQNNRATVVVSRHQQAMALRESLKQLDVERKQMVLATVKLNQQRRSEMYEARHASHAATAEVDSSAYGSLITATRTPQRFEAGMTGKQLLAARDVSVTSSVASLAPHPLLEMASACATGTGAGAAGRGDGGEGSRHEGGDEGAAGEEAASSDAPRARPKVLATTVVSASPSAATLEAGAGLFNKLSGADQGGGPLGSSASGGKKRATRYRPLLLTVKTVGWTGRGRDAPGTDLTVDVHGVTTVAELKERIRKRRAAWAGLPSLRVMYKGHLVEDDTPVDESWAKSFVVAMEGQRPDGLPLPSEPPSDAAARRSPASAVRDRLRQTLDANYLRVLDLFRSWDVDESGTITATELRRALHELGDTTPTDAVDALFASFDQSIDGKVEYRELHQALRAR